MLNYIFLATISMFHYINSPTANMRELPKESSEIVSQGYFSEPVSLIEEKDEWTKVETTIDHYQGWIKTHQLIHKKNDFYADKHLNIRVNRCAAHLYHMQNTVYGPLMTLPFESTLKLVDIDHDKTSRWIKVMTVNGKEAFIQRGDVTFDHTLLNREQMTLLSLQFLGLPYTWGGRSSFGYDCSGFVQMLYRQMGIYLPRDSKDQINWEGFAPVEIANLIPGDLIFFGLSEDKIRHVGMYIGSGQFIHATVSENAPYIRISRLSEAEWNGSGKLVYHAARTLKKSINK